MVHGRFLPTSFFPESEVMALASGDARLILVGLVLSTGDDTRGALADLCWSMRCSRQRRERDI